MTARIRCAIYTRKSSEEGLEQSFNSLQAQCEACEAYILSQRHEGCLTLAKLSKQLPLEWKTQRDVVLAGAGL